MRKYLSIVNLILWKDLVSEFREKLNIIYFLILAPAVSLMFFVFIGEQNPVHLFFLTILIINLITNQRISRQEVTSQGELILINIPFDLSVLCLSKILFTFLLNFLILIVALVMFIFLLGDFFFSNVISFIIFSISFSLGLSIILTTFSLMLERIRSEGQFMLIMIYPLIIPFLVLSYNCLSEINILDLINFVNTFSLQVLIAFDILLLAVCPILFSYSLRR
tara:strand:+ start:1847 stop:2512 length:666 start_codon:yes stop_codon:yes gene_type:complete